MSKIDWANFEQELTNCDVRKNPNFTSRIVPTKFAILGWYTPDLRALVRSVKQENLVYIIDNMPQNFYEETLIKALLLGRIKDINTLLPRLDKFILDIDNWATCDMLCSDLKIVKKNYAIIWDKIEEWIKSEHEFVVRVAIVLLMRYYLNDNYFVKTLNLVTKVNSNYFYINMAIGWLLCEAFVKDFDKTYSYLEYTSTHLNSDVFKITSGKVRDSFRLSPEQKQRVKNLCEVK